jgi:hypothetical protein
LGFLDTPAKPQYIRAHMSRSINDVLCQKKVCQELNILIGILPMVAGGKSFV